MTKRRKPFPRAKESADMIRRAEILDRADKFAAVVLTKGAPVPRAEMQAALKQVSAQFGRVVEKFGERGAVAVLAAALDQFPVDGDTAMRHALCEIYAQRRMNT